MHSAACLVIIATLGMANSSLGQTTIIDLWDGKIPAAIPNKNYQQLVDSADNWIKMKFVSKPTLTMYPTEKGRGNGTAVLICPGGGYGALAISHEGAEVAAWLNKLGITAFVLHYRLPHESIMVDKSIGQRAKEWNLDPDKVGVLGFSAGGHLASTLSTHYEQKVYESNDSTSARPNFSILIYPVISMEDGITHNGSRVNLLGAGPTLENVRHYSNDLQVNDRTPPAFLIHSMDDHAVPPQNSIRYALALQKHRIPCELHLYHSGGHGYGLGRSRNTESSWPDDCRRWLEAFRYIPASSK
jgi:acetyl esterase/lipase